MMCKGDGGNSQIGRSKGKLTEPEHNPKTNLSLGPNPKADFKWGLKTKTSPFYSVVPRPGESRGDGKNGAARGLHIPPRKGFPRRSSLSTRKQHVSQYKIKMESFPRRGCIVFLPVLALKTTTRIASVRAGRDIWAIL